MTYGIAKELLAQLGGGCSALTWETENGLHLWGRNFDFNRIADGSRITYLPENTSFYTIGTSLEGNLDESSQLYSKYAVLGTGSLVLQSTPTLFEGINEKGLMGGQLYYRKFAEFPEQVKQELLPLQPAFAMTYFLAQCRSVEDVVFHLKNKVCLVKAPILGAVPPIHWMFSDRSGESIIIESDKSGLNIYRNSMGVLTNSPGYPWHLENMLNYPGTRKPDFDDLKINGTRIEQCFSGSGSSWLPGGCTSPARFVRLAYLKHLCERGKTEIEGTSRMFRILQNVSFPLGLVSVAPDENLSEYDVGVTAYDYTIYTAVMCSESLSFYWATYDNPELRKVNLNELKGEKKILQFLLTEPEAMTIRPRPI